MWNKAEGVGTQGLLKKKLLHAKQISKRLEGLTFLGPSRFPTISFVISIKSKKLTGAAAENFTTKWLCINNNDVLTFALICSKFQRINVSGVELLLMIRNGYFVVKPPTGIMCVSSLPPSLGTSRQTERTCCVSGRISKGYFTLSLYKMVHWTQQQSWVNNWIAFTPLTRPVIQRWSMENKRFCNMRRLRHTIPFPSKLYIYMLQKLMLVSVILHFRHSTLDDLKRI